MLIACEPASSATSPVGMPLALVALTLTLTLTGCPCVMLVGESCKVALEPRNVTFFQLDTRFAAFTEPSPVARS